MREPRSLTSQATRGSTTSPWRTAAIPTPAHASIAPGGNETGDAVGKAISPEANGIAEDGSGTTDGDGAAHAHMTSNTATATMCLITRRTLTRSSVFRCGAQEQV
jgi:hypothetical protein